MKSILLATLLGICTASAGSILHTNEIVVSGNSIVYCTNNSAKFTAWVYYYDAAAIKRDAIATRIKVQPWSWMRIPLPAEAKQIRLVATERLPVKSRLNPPCDWSVK